MLDIVGLEVLSLLKYVHLTMKSWTLVSYKYSTSRSVQMHTLVGRMEIHLHRQFYSTNYPVRGRRCFL
jgi:hypothetical protein